jgi:hypothetical protein
MVYSKLSFGVPKQSKSKKIKAGPPPAAKDDNILGHSFICRYKTFFCFYETEQYVISTEGGAFAAAVERSLYFACMAAP